MEKCQLKFYLRSRLSPTYYKLAEHLREKNWTEKIFPFLADFGESNLNYNHGIATQLEFKHRLAELVQSYCLEIMPETYVINDNNWHKVLIKLSKNIKLNKKIWILKPSLLNNGQNIIIFNNIEHIQTHFFSSNRMGGEHVLQEYIISPHLLKGPNNQGHKYSLRMFMILTNYNGAFLYPQGYFNIAIKPYCIENFNELSCHITNEHLQKDHINVIQIPTFKYDLFKPIYPKIKHILTQLIYALNLKYPDLFLKNKYCRKMAIFGLDFIVDSTQRVWLIEANHAPCFPVEADHDLQNSLYHDFWVKVIENFVQPIAIKTKNEKIYYNVFEKLE